MSVITYHQFKYKYRFDCQLSHGSFGKVCQIQEFCSKKYYALKKVIAKKKQQLEDIENQIRLLNQFKHPFIVQVKETYKIQINNTFAKPFWEIGIIMQLARCSLEHIIRMKKYVGPFEFILQQTIGLIRILFVLQQQNIVHRDIKPANILILQGADNSCRWKLADFGLALDLSRNRVQENFAGSFEYASPKLKRKFKYPNLKIATNSFKDDVFSLGVTLLQTITGLRTYNTVAFEKLRQVCYQKKLIHLVDIMLEQDQEKRPCFKQLMILIEKDFKHYLANTQLENAKQEYKMHQKIGQNLGNSQETTDKTVIKKYEKQIDKTIINIGKPIQCIANIDEIIMCGCENGELVFVKDFQTIVVGKIHQRNVSQFFDDQKGNIWSIGGDLNIKIWSKKQLTKALRYDVKQVIISSTKIFKKSQQVSSLILELNDNLYRTIKLPIQNSCGCSCFYGEDENNFAIGFYDGRIYIRWVGNQYHEKLFIKPVLAIKLSKNRSRFWLCSLDGQAKCIQTKSLTPMNKIFYKKGVEFIQLFVNEEGNEEFVSLITLNGQEIVLNQSLQCVFQNSLSRNRIMNIVKSGKTCYMLSDMGEIVDSGEQKRIQLNSRGWNCLSILPNQQLIAGSFIGDLAWISR